MKRVWMVTIMALCSVTLVFAHGNEKHLKGVVTQVTNSAITIQTTDGKNMEVAVMPTTKFMKSGKTISAADIKKNDRVVIHAKSKGAKLEATMVMVGSMKVSGNNGDMKGMDTHPDTKDPQSAPK